MSEQAERRKTGEEKLAKLRVERDRIRTLEAIEFQESVKTGREAAELALDAVAGDRKVLSKQTALFVKKDEHDRQIKNLKTVGVDIDAKIAEAEAALPNFILAEGIEKIAAEIPKLSELAKKLSVALTPIAADFGALKKQILSIAATALPLLGGSDKVSKLAASLQQTFDGAVRAGFFQIFHAQGIELFDSVKYSGQDFEEALGVPLGELQRALESRLHTTSGVPVAGRAFFIAKTNISGLHGVHITAGEKISLQIDDPAVLRLVAASALEQIFENKGVSA